MTYTDLASLQTLARSRYSMGLADVRDALLEAQLDPKHLDTIEYSDAQTACKKYVNKHRTLYRERVRD